MHIKDDRHLYNDCHRYDDDRRMYDDRRVYDDDRRLYNDRRLYDDDRRQHARAELDYRRRLAEEAEIDRLAVAAARARAFRPSPYELDPRLRADLHAEQIAAERVRAEHVRAERVRAARRALEALHVDDQPPGVFMRASGYGRVQARFAAPRHVAAPRPRPAWYDDALYAGREDTSYRFPVQQSYSPPSVAYRRARVQRLDCDQRLPLRQPSPTLAMLPPTQPDDYQPGMFDYYA